MTQTKTLFKEYGLLQQHLDLYKKLSQAARISATTISRWKSIDATTPDSKSLKAIADSTGCSFDWFMHGRGELLLQETPGTQQQVRKAIDLSQEKETFTYSKMITMTTKFLESISDRLYL